MGRMFHNLPVCMRWNLETSEQLELAGGSHVLLFYMPSNSRVEQQVFGRTARKGRSGSVQSVMYDSQRRSVEELQRVREDEEAARLARLLEAELPQMKIEEDIASQSICVWLVLSTLGLSAVLYLSLAW
jgi:hypothetical protein